MECYCTDNKCLPCMIGDGEFDPSAYGRMMESHAALVEVAEILCSLDRDWDHSVFNILVEKARAALKLAGEATES